MNYQEAFFQRMKKRRVYKSFKRRKRAILAKLPFFIFAGLLSFVILSVGIFAFYAKDLPRPDKIVRREGFSTKIYDRNGELLYDVFADQRRTPVDFSQVPDHLKNATIAIEDKNFYKHSGFDPLGYVRAVYNIVVHHKLQGGSTLTQQLVKNVLLSSQRTISRKIKEFILTVQIESRYSKDEILQMYLNEAPYGGTAWGVQAASELYFGKDVSELGLTECALLAGLPQRPSVYSPFSDYTDAYIERTMGVLRRMREDGFITKEQEEQASEQLKSLEFASDEGFFRAPHFVMYVKKQLEDQYGERVVEQGGLRVTTTLDYSLQEEAQKIVSEEIEKVEYLNITNGAAVAMNPETGEILAMVGSKAYNDPDYDGKVNVTLSLRQPGSAIKPVTYLAALQNGYTSATLIMDTQTTFPGEASLPDYKPVNYDGKFHGPMQARYALANSINVTAVKMLAKVGVLNMLSTAFDMGLSTLEPTTKNLQRFGLSVTLGGGEVRLLELAQAYSAFANTGIRVNPASILKVEDKDGNVLDEYKPVKDKRILEEEHAFLISDILSDNSARALTFGESSLLVVPGRTVAAKTGTTNDKRDNWTIGWTPQVVVGVWVGNNDNSQMKAVASGISGASPIWRKIIMAYLKDKPVVSFTVPEKIVSAEVDTVSGYRSHHGFPSRTEYFVKGTEPSGDDPVHAMLKVCRSDNGKLATNAQIARGEYDEKEFYVFKEDDPLSKDGKNLWQEGIDAWLSLQSDPKYRPPTEYCGDQEEMEVTIDSPGNESRIDGNEVRVEGRILAVNSIRTIKIFINGQEKEKIENTTKFDKIFTLDKGSYIVKVEAEDEKGKKASREAKFGIKQDWDYIEPTPTPTPTKTPTPTPIP